MKKAVMFGAALSLILTTGVVAQPTVSFSGFLDADVWTDFEGNFFANQELDVGMSVGFTESVSANLYVTMESGSVPAGGANPADRWVSVDFDGVDLTFATGFGEFTVGDLVYQFGGFNYYGYKRLSMITPENFTRGVQYTYSSEMFTQSLLTGVANVDMSTGDVVGVSEISFAEEMGVSLYYGLRGSVMDGFENMGVFFGGLEFLGTFAEALEVKADVGYQSLGGDANTFAILVEPLLTIGGFSTALSYYQFIDPDDTGANFVGDDMFVYVEPGYAFNDYLAFGLPLEYHEGAMDEMMDASDEEVEDASIWVVPTLYVYPTDGAQWWFWGGATIPLDEKDVDGADTEVGFSLGSEIIVEF